jgi:hypothetical protein
MGDDGRGGLLAGSAVAAAAVAALVVVPGEAGAIPPGPYVALGDSYTSGPGILPPAAGAPADCTQSARNYPHLVAEALGRSLTDVSCGGATVQNMTTAQYPDQPPQFNALNSSVSLVTIGIGGNDHGLFIDAIADCIAADAAAAPLDPNSAPCKAKYGSTFNNDIDSDAPNIAAAMQGIHQRSPHAQVFVVGYLDILPQSGGCYPQMPLTNGDVAFLNGVEQHLNSMLSQQAAANQATFVDTFTPSIGHDACQPEGVRWVEPPVPQTDAASIHPNAAGMAAVAQFVEAAIH